MRKPLALILSLWVLSTVFIPHAVGEDPKGNISFLPNVIPFTTVYKEVNKTSNIEGSGERFRFEWNNPLDDDDPNRFDIELFFNATLLKKVKGSKPPIYENVTKMWSLHDFETDFECTTTFVKNKNESVIQWGWIIDNPDLTNEWLHHGWMRIEDTYPFEVDDIQLETIEPTPEMNFTIKRFHLPDNLILSFEDLFFKGFMVDVLNPTEVVIWGFEGKIRLNLDPITYSAPTITVIGGTEGSELDFKDIWDADQAGGWNVVINNNNSNNQYEFQAKIVLGNGTVAGTTWFADIHRQIKFYGSAISVYLAVMIDVKAYAHLRFGSLVDASKKIGKNGVDVITEWYYADNTADTIVIWGRDNSEVSLYASHFYSDQLDYNRVGRVISQENLTIYQSLFDQTGVWLYTSSGTQDLFDIISVNAVGQPCGIQSYGSCASRIINRISLYDSKWAIGFYAYIGGDLSNVYARKCDPLIYSGAITVNHNLINVDADEWKFLWYGTSTAGVYSQYTFDLTVTTASNVPIEDANVTLTYYGEGGGTHGTWLTDVNGEIPPQTVTVGFYNQTGGNTIYTYNPYEITITKAGYLTYQRNFTQLEEKSWNIALLTESGYNWFAATIIIGIFAAFMTIYALTGKN